MGTRWRATGSRRCVSSRRKKKHKLAIPSSLAAPTSFGSLQLSVKSLLQIQRQLTSNEAEMVSIAVGGISIEKQIESSPYDNPTD